jgi:hypothetical protein
MTIRKGDRVILRGVVTEVRAPQAFVRIDAGASGDPEYPRLAEPPVPVFLDTIEPPVYLSAADIAAHFGVPVNTVQTWRARYGPDRSEDEIAKAPTCPQPAVYLGRGKPQAGYLEHQLADIEAWRRSLPGKGAGGGRPQGGSAQTS